MADFFYWNKGNNEGFSHLSVYLKNPNNNKPGWYFASPNSYPVKHRGRNGVAYHQMPVRFGIHHPNTPDTHAAKPTKMGQPGDYLVAQRTGGLQLIGKHEFALNYFTQSRDIPGQKIADSSITIQSTTTGKSPLSTGAPMSGNSGNY